MKRITSIALLFILILMGSCRKQEFPEPSVSAPVFNVSASIGGVALDLNPGADGSYMYTGHSEVEEGNVVLSSGIAPSNCPECGPALWIDWNSNTVSGISEPFDPDLHFLNGDYNFREAFGNGPSSMEILDFEELQLQGAVFILNGEELIDDIAILDPLQGAVEFQFINPLDPLFITQNTMFFSPALFPNGCDSDTRIISSFGLELEDEELIIYPPHGILEDYLIDWSINGFPTIQTTGVFPIPLEIGSNELITIDANVFDEGGTLLWSVSSVVLSGVGGNMEPFALELSNTPLPVSGDPDVVIRYVNEDGIVFSSNNCGSPNPQPPSSYFSIADQELYQANEEGVSTRIVTVNTSVMLFPENGENLDPLSLSFEGGRFGFATGD